MVTPKPGSRSAETNAIEPIGRGICADMMFLAASTVSSRNSIAMRCKFDDLTLIAIGLRQLDRRFGEMAATRKRPWTSLTHRRIAAASQVLGVRAIL